MAKATRRSSEEVAKLVAEIDALVAGGMSKEAAAEKVDLAPSVYQKYKRREREGALPRRVTGSVRADSLPPRPVKKKRGNVHVIDETSIRSVAARIAYLDARLAKQQSWVDERIRMVGILVKLLKTKP